MILVNGGSKVLADLRLVQVTHELDRYGLTPTLEVRACPYTLNGIEPPEAGYRDDPIARAASDAHRR